MLRAEIDELGVVELLLTQNNYSPHETLAEIGPGHIRFLLVDGQHTL